MLTPCDDDDQDGASSDCCSEDAEVASPGLRRTFSELVLALPADTHQFCLSLLWRLRDHKLVQSWCWEEGLLRVRADTDALEGMSSIEGSYSNVWLLRLIEAAYRLEADRLRSQVSSRGRGCWDGSRRSSSSRPSPREEDAATDFAFLLSDPGTAVSAA
jgi:hypothetical protein